jgi:hypothetical protein
MRDASRVWVTGPLERYAAGFVAELSEAGYRPGSASVHLRLLAHLRRWLEAEGLAASEFSEEGVERFRRLHVARVPSLRGAQGLVAAGFGRDRAGTVDRLLFMGHVGMEVDVRC